MSLDCSLTLTATKEVVDHACCERNCSAVEEKPELVARGIRKEARTRLRGMRGRGEREREGVGDQHSPPLAESRSPTRTRKPALSEKLTAEQTRRHELEQRTRKELKQAQGSRQAGSNKAGSRKRRASTHRSTWRRATSGCSAPSRETAAQAAGPALLLRLLLRLRPPPLRCCCPAEARSSLEAVAAEVGP